MKLLFLLLLVAGLVAGPGYWLFNRLYGGGMAANLVLQVDRNGVLSSPEFALTSDMAPVALVLMAHGDFVPNMDPDEAPRERYRLELQENATILDTNEFELGAPAVAVSEPVFRERVLQLNGATDGVFRVRIEPLGDRRMTLGQARLEVRRNVPVADGRVLLTGIALLGLGTLGLLLLP
jgi:hypothetical protein